jgi:hypothetical protein
LDAVCASNRANFVVGATMDAATPGGRVRSGPVAGVTREDFDWASEPASRATTVRFRWWLARFLGSLSDSRRAVVAMALLAPLTFLAIFLIVVTVS